MQKLICDACGKDISGKIDPAKFTIPDNIVDGEKSRSMYTMPKPTIYYTFDLCSDCASKVYLAAYEMIKKIKVAQILEDGHEEFIQEIKERRKVGSRLSKYDQVQQEKMCGA
jgi:hypothetical protein